MLDGVNKAISVPGSDISPPASLETRSAQRVYCFLSDPAFCGIRQKAQPFGQYPFYGLMEFNWRAKAFAGEFINVDHMFHLNPVPHSGTEDFDLSPKA